MRAEATWVLAVVDDSTDIGDQLLTILRSESDSTVKINIYQALSRQNNLDLEHVFHIVTQERDTSVQLAGLSLLASVVGDNEDNYIKQRFDQTIVPQLVSHALGNDRNHDRLKAIIALQKAKTPAAGQALIEIAAKSDDAQIVKAASSNVPSFRGF